MTLEEINYIAQTIAAVAVALSLLFVGVQIRQNTRATRAASHGAVSSALNEVNRMFAENEGLTKIWLAGRKDRGSLSEEDRWRFDAMARAYFHVCETMFIQARLGAGDKGVMKAEEEGMKAVLAAPGAKNWWVENPFGFCAEFRAYVESLTAGVKP